MSCNNIWKYDTFSDKRMCGSVDKSWIFLNLQIEPLESTYIYTKKGFSGAKKVKKCVPIY